MSKGAQGRALFQRGIGVREETRGDEDGRVISYDRACIRLNDMHKPHKGAMSCSLSTGILRVSTNDSSCHACVFVVYLPLACFIAFLSLLLYFSLSQLLPLRPSLSTCFLSSGLVLRLCGPVCLGATLARYPLKCKGVGLDWLFIAYESKYRSTVSLNIIFRATYTSWDCCPVHPTRLSVASTQQLPCHCLLKSLSCSE